MRTRHLVAASLLCCLAGGCGARFYDPLAFSPDGKMLAHLCREVFMLAPEGALGGREKRTVYWYPADAPARRGSVVLAAGGPDYGDYEHDMAFSPDSRRLAAWTNRRLIVIDLADGTAREIVRLAESRSPTAAKIDSMAWIGASRIAYASWARSPNESDKAAVRLTVYRLALEPPDATPQAAFESRFHAPEDVIRTEVAAANWSPHGRWVLLADKADPGGLTLLEPATGRRHVLDARTAEIVSAAWRPDAAAALCIVRRKGAERAAALLIDPQARTIADLTEDFARAGLIEHPPTLRWTHDGTHVFAETSPYVDSPYPLLRLRPFTVIPLGERVKGTVGFFDPGYVPRPTPIRMCPVAGHVLVHAADGSHYLADFGGRRFRKVPGSVISPDCGRIAGFDPKAGKVHVSAFDARIVGR